MIQIREEIQASCWLFNLQQQNNRSEPHGTDSGPDSSMTEGTTPASESLFCPTDKWAKGGIKHPRHKSQHTPHTPSPSLPHTCFIYQTIQTKERGLPRTATARSSAISASWWPPLFGSHLRWSCNSKYGNDNSQLFQLQCTICDPKIISIWSKFQLPTNLLQQPHNAITRSSDNGKSLVNWLLCLTVTLSVYYY